jgi:hypothetical protein
MGSVFLYVCIACVQSVKDGEGVDQLLDAKLLFKEVEGYFQFHSSWHGDIRLGKKKKTARLDFRGGKLYLYEFSQTLFVRVFSGPEV